MRIVARDEVERNHRAAPGKRGRRPPILWRHTSGMSIIQAGELLARLNDPKLRVADTRWYLNRSGASRAAYRAGHLPGAIFLDLDADLSAPTGPGRHPLPEPAWFAARLGGLGFADGDTIVAYDDVGGSVAARLWWMLDDLGFRDAFVLDGGIQAWTAGGGPLTGDVPTWPPARLTLRPTWSNVIDRQELVGRLGSVALLDARARERYRGDVEPVDPAAGHIPTALNNPFSANLGADGRFLPSVELAARLRSFGAGDRIVVTSCGSGTNACHTALAMRLAGLPDPLLYAGSFSDWSRSGMPVATGDEPGSMEATVDGGHLTP